MFIYIIITFIFIYIIIVPKCFQFDYQSDEEIFISESDNESDLSELSEDDSELENEDVPPFREFGEISIENPPPPPARFPFYNTLDVNLEFDDDGDGTLIL